MRTPKGACARCGDSVWSNEPRVRVGRVGSSDVWAQSAAEIHRLHTELGTLCEEMEAYAVFRTCNQFNVPCVAIKDIVNNELQPNDDAEAETGKGESIILEEIGKRAAALAIATIARLARP